jgi:hypothetical protein
MCIKHHIKPHLPKKIIIVLVENPSRLMKYDNYLLCEV